MLKFLAFSLAFWLVQFAYQFYVLVPGQLGTALVRSSGLSGATFLSLALLSSVVFKFRPRLARYWHVRRSFGVVGTLFITLHFRTVLEFLYQNDLAVLTFSLNPAENPAILGLAAYPFFILMALTSTDWAVGKMGFRRWKALHRLVYFAYLAAVFHFLTINPTGLLNPAGYVLLAVTVLALGGHLYWFVRTVARGKSSPLGIAVGILAILLGALLTFLLFLAP